MGSKPPLTPGVLLGAFITVAGVGPADSPLPPATPEALGAFTTRDPILKFVFETPPLIFGFLVERSTK